MNSVYLKKGRDKSARQYHPWIFSGAVGKVEGSPAPGEIVRVLDNDKRFVAYGYFNSHSQIQVRLLEWNEANTVNDEWWYDRVSQAVRRRGTLASDDSTNAYRLVFGEADFLPGLIVDKYENHVVLQSLTAGIEAAKPIIVQALNSLLNPSGIYERSDVDVRDLEGLPQQKGVLVGNEPEDEICIRENNLKFTVDIKNGQKTGYYLDQRENRRITAAYADGLQVLDCFSYAGTFAIYALKHGAKSAMLVDSSASSLARVKENAMLNRIESSRVEYVKGDAFQVLRQFSQSKQKFDMVILDPPKFASTKSQTERALAGYKDINMLAMNLLTEGGILATYSCSGAVNLASFKVALFWASLDARKQVQYIHTLSQGIDHPRLISFPESEYLKGVICRVY
jgi:23S rRNA (cytosine1962-C5)-methyltransferase